MESNGQYNPRARPRPTLSCLECKRKKLKCDRLQPCVQCTKRGRPSSCQYADNIETQALLQRTASSASYGSDPQSSKRPRLDQDLDVGQAIRDLQTRVATLEERQDGRTRDSASSNMNGNRIPSSGMDDHCGTEPAASTDKHQLVVKDSGQRTKLEMGIKHMIRNKFPDALQLLLKVARGDPTLFKDVGEVQAAQKKAFKSNFQRRTKSIFTTVPIEAMLEILPSREDLGSLLEVYFAHWPSDLRVLSEDETKDVFMRRFVNLGVGDYTHLPLLTAITALGQACLANLHDGQSSILRGVGGATAVDRCSLLRQHIATMARKRLLEVETIRMHVILLQTEELLFQPPDVLWQSVGSIVRMALIVGLPVDVSNHPKLTNVQRDERQRLCQAIVDMDLRLSRTCGMPSMARLLDVSLPKPAKTDESPEPGRSWHLLGVFIKKLDQADRQLQDRSMQIELHSFLARHRFEVMEAVSKTYQDMSKDQAQRVDRAMHGLAATCGLLGGNIKDVLFLTAARPGLNERTLREQLASMLTIAGESLRSQGYIAEPTREMSLPHSHGTTDSTTFSEYSDALLDFFDLGGLDFDTDWSAAQVQSN